MGINLQKGQRVDLTKGNAGLGQTRGGFGLGYQQILRA